jgi:hypothetical protein
MNAYTPLNDPGQDGPTFPASVDGELRLARKLLDDIAATNIHDHQAMVRAAAGLDYRLRALVAALTAERGESR